MPWGINLGKNDEYDRKRNDEKQAKKMEKAAEKERKRRQKEVNDAIDRQKK